TVNRYKMAAATDPLTGLLNRRGFFEAAGSLMAISRRQRMAPVSVLVFDLDHFKAINDKNGHAIGDAMLQLFAKIARETLRATDIVGRLGVRNSSRSFRAPRPKPLSRRSVCGRRLPSPVSPATAGASPRPSASGSHRARLQPRSIC